MKKYKKIFFETDSAMQSEILMAQLEDVGFYAFETAIDGLTGYIEEQFFDETELRSLLKGDIAFYVETIEEQNWNKEWESSFSPVVIENYVAIRAGFHAPVEGVQYEIIITPKMSFGTGHHDTTFLMISEMQKINFNNQSVIDFGTGTGVLAILASLSGAKEVAAVDIDEWSIVNAKENISNNNCKNILVSMAPDLEGTGMAGIILANINKNILLQHAQALAAHLYIGGLLLLSGFFTSDKGDIIEHFEHAGLKFISDKARGDWLVLSFQKS